MTEPEPQVVWSDVMVDMLHPLIKYRMARVGDWGQVVSEQLYQQADRKVLDKMILEMAQRRHDSC